MSNKPRINAFCDAGCKWETVHKADFMKSASHVPVLVNADGNYYLEKGKEYKIFAPKDASGQFTCGVNFVYQTGGAADVTAYKLTHENEDKYAESFVFKILDASLNATADTITLIYEIAGIRYEETIGSGSESYSLLTENYLYISNASAVYLFNSDATITAKDGADGKDGEVTTEQLNEAVSEAVSEITPSSIGALQSSDLLTKVYPVGSVYMSTNSTSPASFLGGSWTRIQDKFLLSAGSSYSAGSTGGSADAVVVSHNHAVSGHAYVNNNDTGNTDLGMSVYKTYISGADATVTQTVGESGAGKNMPPYLAVYVWKRTA